MEQFLKNGPPRSGLPPDLVAILATETAKLPDRSQNVTTHERIDLPPNRTATGQDEGLSQRPGHPQLAPLSLTPTPPPTTSFRAVNALPITKPATKRAQKPIKPATPKKNALAPLAPAPARPQPRLAPSHPRTQQQVAPPTGPDLMGLPAEIRVEIFKLVLENVALHILPTEAPLAKRTPHALTRVNKLMRNEVLPIIHARCPIEGLVTDFNFSGMLEFMARIPPQDEKALLQNDNLKIKICTTGDKSKGVQWNVSDSLSLGRWLRYRADQHRLQPRWQYYGPWPGSKVESAIRRKINRMTEDGKKQELMKLGTAIGMTRLVKEKKDDAEAS